MLQADDESLDSRRHVIYFRSQYSFTLVFMERAKVEVSVDNTYIQRIVRSYNYHVLVFQDMAIRLFF